jgi:hypothetical protein
MLAALIAVLAIAAVAAFTVIAYRRGWRWTGLPADPGDGSPAIPPRPAKTLWDWLQLLVVPLVLALAAFALNAAQSDRDQRQEERRAQRERAAAEDRAREDTLRTYIQQMSDLITRYGVRGPYDRGADTSTLARTLTLVALRRLDGKRKGIVVQFLLEERLIIFTFGWRSTRRGVAPAYDVPEPKVSLQGADLRGAVMPKDLTTIEGGGRSGAAALESADLQEADFRGGDLTGVSFWKANLRGAHFDGASLNGAEFPGACLSGATFVGLRKVRSNLAGPDFRGAAGRGIDFSNASLDGALFTNTTLTNVKLTGASTKGVRWPRGWTSTGLRAGDAQSRRVSDALARRVCGGPR